MYNKVYVIDVVGFNFFVVVFNGYCFDIMLLVFLYLVILEYNIVVNGVFNIYKYSVKFMDLNMIDICDGINNIGVFGWFFLFDVCVVVVELSLF